MRELGDIADGKGDVWARAESGEGGATEEVLVGKTLLGSNQCIVVHVKREADVRIGWNSGRMNVSIAIFSEEVFNVEGLVKVNRTKSPVPGDAQPNKSVWFIDMHLEDVIHVGKDRVDVKLAWRSN